MKEEYKQSSSPKSGTFIALLLGLTAFIFGFSAIACFFLRAILPAWLCLLLCLTALAVFVRLRLTDFVNFFLSRQARYGANVALSLLGVIGIAVFINVIIAQKFDKRADLTEQQLHTLSEQTKTVLKSLNRPIQVTAFFTGGENSPLEYERAKDMLALYARETEFLTVSFVNPYIDAQLAAKYEVRRDGTTVFESADRFEEVTTVEEQKFTNALLKLLRNKTKTIYFLSRHGERSIGDFTPIGYSGAKEALENQNYTVLPFSPLLQPSIPADCAVLVIAGLKSPLMPDEMEILTEYLARDGKLLLLFEPAISSDPALSQLMRRWGVEVGNDLVIDRARASVHGVNAPFPAFEQHEITRALHGARIPFLGTRSVTPAEEIPEGLRVKSLGKTVGERGMSWGETAFEIQPGTNPVYNPGIDTPPPVSIAVAVEQQKGAPPADKNQNSNRREERVPRMVVFGDSDFASNYSATGILRHQNRALFLATINWLTLEEELIAISPIDFRELELRPMLAEEAALVQILSVFLIPLVVFIAGVLVWWQRRG